MKRPGRWGSRAWRRPLGSGLGLAVALAVLAAGCSSGGPAPSTVGPGTPSISDTAAGPTGSDTDGPLSPASSGTALPTGSGGSADPDTGVGTATAGTGGGSSNPGTSDPTSPTGPITTDSPGQSGGATKTPSSTSTPKTSVVGPTTDYRVDATPTFTTIVTSSSLAITVSMPTLYSGQQKEDVDAAVIAYIGFLRISDDSLAQPKKDWAQEISKFATGVAATKTVSAAAQFAADNIRAVGHATVATAVVTVSSVKIGLRGCIDTSGVDVLDAHGKSIRAASGPGGYWKYIETADLIRVDGVWKVSIFSPDAGTPC